MDQGEELAHVVGGVLKGAHAEDLRAGLGVHTAVFHDAGRHVAGGINTDAGKDGTAHAVRRKS